MASTRKKRPGAARKGALKRRRPVSRQQASGAATTTAAPPRRPSDDYAFGPVVGQGLAGPVRSARYLPTGIEVAVESMPDPLRSDPRFIDRLAEAGRRASTLRDPGVVALYDVLHDGDELLAVGELPGGVPLSDAASPPPAIEVVDRVLGALTAIHAHGLVHGLVGRDALVICADGATRLAGVGVAMAVRSGVGGTPSVADDLVAAAAMGLDLLGAGSSDRAGRDRSKRAGRLLRRVVATEAAAPLDSAAAIRDQLRRAADSSLPRRARQVALRAGLILAPMAAGAAIGLTIAAARGAIPANAPLTVQPGIRLTASPAIGGCGTTFVFTASGGVEGAGTLVYQWSRSDGLAGPLRRLQIGPGDGGFRVRIAWNLTAPASGPLTMTLRVLSPSPTSVSRSVSAGCQ